MIPLVFFSFRNDIVYHMSDSVASRAQVLRQSLGLSQATAHGPMAGAAESRAEESTALAPAAGGQYTSNFQCPIAKSLMGPVRRHHSMHHISIQPVILWI